MNANEFNNFIGAIALTASEVHQFSDTSQHCTSLGGSDDPHASPSSEIEETFPSKDMQRSNNRVLVHSENRGEVDSRWQSLTLRGFAINDGSTNLRGHLFVEWKSRIFVLFRNLHRTTSHSTINVINRKEC